MPPDSSDEGRTEDWKGETVRTREGRVRTSADDRTGRNRLKKRLLPLARSKVADRPKGPTPSGTGEPPVERNKRVTPVAHLSGNEPKHRGWFLDFHLKAFV